MDETDEQTQTEPTGKPCRRWGRWFFCLRALFVICLAPVIFAGVAAVMMINREITAPSWIVEQIEARASEVLDGAQLDFGTITARIGRDLHPHVRLVDTRLFDRDGVMLTRVPVVEGMMSPRGLILRHEVMMQEIRLIGAQINLRRARDGTVAVALASDAAEVSQARSIPELLDQLDQVFERPQLEALETVRAEGLIVNFDDARARRSWVVDGGTLALDLRNGETALRGNLSLLSGRAEVTTVTLSYSSPRGSRAAQFAVNIDDAITSDIAAQSPALTWLRDVEAPISAALRTELDENGALGPLSATLEIGQGALQPNEATQPVQFESAKAYLTYDPVHDKISFTDIALETEWGSLRANGDAYLREIIDGLPHALLGQFHFRDVALNPLGLYDVTPTVEAASVDLRLRFDPFRIEIGQMVASNDGLQVLSSGSLTAADDGWIGTFDSSINEISPDQLLAFWPPTVKPRTRNWISQNLSQGHVINGNVGIRVAPGRPRDVALGFEFEDADIRFLRQMPLINGGAGVASIIDHRFVVTLDKGTVVPAQGGSIDVTGTTFTILDTREKPSNGVVDLALDGSVTSVLSVLNEEPFTFLDKAGKPVTLADGRAEVGGQITFPLRRGLTLDELGLDVRADLRGVRSDVLIPGRRFAAAQLEVAVSNEGLTISGPVRLGGVAADGAWTQRFGVEHAGRSQVSARVALSQVFMDEFNIGLPPGTISGNGRGDLTLDLTKGRSPAFSLVSNLRGLRVAIPAVGWVKPADQDGNLRISGTLGAVPSVDRLQVSGAGLTAEGQIRLSADGGLDTARFTRLEIGNWLDAPITLQGRGQGQPVGVVINGGRLDLRRASFGASTGEGGPMQIALDRLQITEGIALTAFSGNFNGTGGFSGQFRGQLNGVAPVEGVVAPRNGRSAVRLSSNDAGAVIRAAGFMDNASGGDVTLILLPAGVEGTFDGTLSVSDLRVRDAPTIAALLDAISVVGLLQQLDGQGLRFDDVDAKFRLTPQQVIVSEASAVGPGLGISIDGIYTLASKQIDLQGVVSPFYLVNSIGSFLTRKGEGLIGFNFNIGGTSDAPRVSVNPLSALTPGIFREIFRRAPPETN
ncbi:uncharacterized protein DUF3971 [Yoonia maritima]|uniref:Uncharacterized protein DUF3971 n=1 Tax=Yoonia maritima TaxID=1435347 RepID=A0A2T0W1P5_9RHOB|nr:AsmA-like C-terminal region-containing protein [Yoonia maritima]PRY78863.1 uncharacterized protein DUF3971 [Yoonia maritima]